LRPQPMTVPFEARKDILFLGGFGHQPNVDAVKYFVREIWPMVCSRNPAMRFIIAGSDVPADLRALDGTDGIEVVGFVRDLGTIFDRVRLSVAPLRFGAGAKGKVAVSLAHGVPAIIS